MDESISLVFVGSYNLPMARDDVLQEGRRVHLLAPITKEGTITDPLHSSPTKKVGQDKLQILCNLLITLPA